MDYTARLNSIINKPGNKMCADCNGRNPRWASISLGVFVCIRCCGIHRALGTHISKMKSTTLDKWTPQMFHLFETVDNEIANAYWESRLPQGYNKPVESSGSYAVETFLRDKYERKLWIGTGPDPLTMATQPKQPDRPQMKIEKKEEKRTLSAGPFDADLLSDSGTSPHLRAHTSTHQPHLSTPDLHSHSKAQENLTGLHGYSQYGSNPNPVHNPPAFNQNHLNLFPNGQAMKQVQNPPPANFSMPTFPQAPLVQGGNGVQTVPVAQTNNFTYNNPAYPPQAAPQYAPQNPYPGQNPGYPGSNFPSQGFPGQSVSNYPGAVQNNPANSYNANIEAEKNMKINQVLSMYSTTPALGQNTGSTGSTGFKPLGAIAAQNFFNQGAQSHPYPTF